MTTNDGWTRETLLERPVEHIDPAAFDARPIIDAYRSMAYSSRTLARATDITNEMVRDPGCAVILTLAGSLISAGLKKSILTLVEHNMVDAIVSTGANIVDQDFFEGQGHRHRIAPGSPEAPPVDDLTLRDLMIDRIYDTYIDEHELRATDEAMRRIIDGLPGGSYSSREIIARMGAFLDEHHPLAHDGSNESIVRTCARKGVPIFCPAFSDCSAGFGVVLHRADRMSRGEDPVAFDSGKDFGELTQIKLEAAQHGSGDTGLLMLGGGVPKNFAQDIVVAAELLDERAGGPSRGSVSMHKYAVQITVADSRDGALSGSTLREACSWGKVDVVHEQMVFGEVSSLLPLLVSDVYHRGHWRNRSERRFSDVLDGLSSRAPSEAPTAAG